MLDQNMVSRFLLIGLALVVLLILLTQYKNYKAQEKKHVKHEKETFMEPLTGAQSMKAPSAEEVMPSEPKDNTFTSVAYESSTKSVGECKPKDKLKVEDLLPKDAANSKWAQVNPAGQGDVDGQNFLTAGYLQGVNTVGSTLKNANKQLRSDPPIERVNIGPWNQTTIEYDSSRKYFEIGEC